jgi:pilus assembly protein CpaC
MNNTINMKKPIISASVCGLGCLLGFALITNLAQAAGVENTATPPRPGLAKGVKKNIKPPAPPLEYLSTEPLVITHGEIKMIPINGKVTRIALGSGNILSTTTVDNQLLIIAEQLGSTSLVVWTERTVHTFRVQVVPKDLAEVRAKIDALLARTPGVKVEQLGTQFVLSGDVHSDALQNLRTALQDVPNLIFNVREDRSSPFTRSVLFRLHFIEIKRSLLEQIGVNWAKQLNGPTFGAIGIAKNEGVYRDLPLATDANALLGTTPAFVRRGDNTGGVFLGLATTLTSRINLGISDGDARVLASPELTAKSGGKARLQAGGEVPIPVAGAFGATSVEFKPYGLIFSIEPQIDSKDIITAKVSTELSQIDPSVTVGNIPGFLTRTTATEVSIKPGEMVALSGLVNSELSNAIDRVPGLGAIPILGRLFRSDDFRNRKTELVVLLETEIISAGDGLARQLRDKGVGAKQEFETMVEQSKQASPVIPKNDVQKNDVQKNDVEKDR